MRTCMQKEHGTRSGGVQGVEEASIVKADGFGVIVRIVEGLDVHVLEDSIMVCCPRRFGSVRRFG
jgi:hypothetical protein